MEKFHELLGRIEVSTMNLSFEERTVIMTVESGTDEEIELRFVSALDNPKLTQMQNGSFFTASEIHVKEGEDEWEVPVDDTVTIQLPFWPDDLE